jgi:hypothetical protein
VNIIAKVTFEAADITSIIWPGESLYGSLPSSILNQFTQLKYLNLSRNSLMGTIPSILGNLPLLSLDLHQNCFNGSIPSMAVTLR